MCMFQLCKTVLLSRIHLLLFLEAIFRNHRSPMVYRQSTPLIFVTPDLQVATAFKIHTLHTKRTECMEQLDQYHRWW